MVIYKMFCNGRPVCGVYPVSKVVPLSYFCGYMLFNSWIQMLIGFPDFLETANTSKRINQRTAMLWGEECLLDQMSKQHAYGKPLVWKTTSHSPCPMSFLDSSVISEDRNQLIAKSYFLKMIKIGLFLSIIKFFPPVKYSNIYIYIYIHTFMYKHIYIHICKMNKDAICKC